jgi:type II secretory pathway component GspD/PulD (secretin)
MTRLSILLGIILLVPVAQADSISTIQLQHRTAEEVIPIVEPMLGAEDAISGQAYQLFLRSSPATLARVREMIDVLDTPAKVLLVSVFQGSSRDLGELGVSAGIRIDNSGASASVSAASTQKSLRDNPIHQLRVSEGTEAYIETGRQIPYFVGGTWIGPEVLAAGVEYKSAVTGFYVLPRVRGDNIILEVSPFKSSQGNQHSGDINTQAASTTVTGRVGEWLLIGGVTRQQEQTKSEIGTTYTTQSNGDSGIWIKADLVQ